jgi:hypothetical protein
MHLLCRELERGLSLDSHDPVTGGVEGFLVAQDAPCDPCQFVGQSRCQLVTMHAGGRIQKPCSEAEALPIVGSHQDDVCGLDEQGSEILAPALGDATQDGSTTCTVLAWDETKPCAEVSPALECLAGANVRDRVNAWNGSMSAFRVWWH